VVGTEPQPELLQRQAREAEAARLEVDPDLVAGDVHALPGERELDLLRAELEEERWDVVDRRGERRAARALRRSVAAARSGRRP
jgi:hypothetical protein